MSDRINEQYLIDFFNIKDSIEGIAELAEIKSKLKRIVFKNNQDICVIDTAADGMYFIESGTVLVLDSDERQINILHAGQYFGEYGVLSGQKRLSTVRSLGRAVVYKMEAEDLLGYLYKHPNVYGDFMKRVYNELSNKHSQILTLSGMHKGVLNHPSNSRPLSARQMIALYGSLLLIYLASMIFVPADTSAPIFIVPIVFMLAYVIITKRTLESLIASGILAAVLVYRTGMFPGYADSLINTISDKGNVYTVLVMTLMGGMINLIVHSGGVTAFEKAAAKFAKTKRSVFFTSLGIMVLTAIDDGLNMLTASYATYVPSREKGIIREKLALFYSMLPTVICSFFPFSLWSIYVTGTLAVSTRENAAMLFIHSIPFNFFSIITFIAMIMLALDHLPASAQMKEAEKRYKDTGLLWPKGSEKYLSVHDTEVWGRISNVIIPIIIFAICSFTIRSFRAGALKSDSVVGLMAALVFMFLLYCFKKIMTPKQFNDILVDGIADSILPVIVYLLTINFSMLLENLGLHTYLVWLIDTFGVSKTIFPFVTFILSMILTLFIGSSWSMYALVFPIALNLGNHLGINPAFMVGVIAGAGIAGECNCPFTSDPMMLANSVGINPVAVQKLRLSYSTMLTAVAAVGYLIAGFFI